MAHRLESMVAMRARKIATLKQAVRKVPSKAFVIIHPCSANGEANNPTNPKQRGISKKYIPDLTKVENISRFSNENTLYQNVLST